MRTATSGANLVRDLQERAARALPAEAAEDADGWLLRHAPGCSWWVGTVLPHGENRSAGLLRRVAEAEDFYAARGAVARFQVTPGVCPDGLDGLLAKRGYRRGSRVSLQVASTARILERTPAGPVRVRLDDRPAGAWFDVRQAVQGPGGDVRAERELLERVEQPCAYASALIGDTVVAVGRAVADTGWAGVFDMATHSRARGRGAARQVLNALAGWARGHAADRMYLQVERDNAPALRLYEQAGFGEACAYHYRTAE